MTSRRRKGRWWTEETAQFIANVRAYAEHDAKMTAALYRTLPERRYEMRLPRIIDGTWDYEPRIGDRIEATDGDTIKVGTLARLDSVTGITQSGFVIYSPRDTRWAYRLISRTKREFQVGDMISGEQADELPVGSIIRVYPVGASYVVAILHRTNRRMRYQRVDNEFAWPSLRSMTIEVLYVNKP